MRSPHPTASFPRRRRPPTAVGGRRFTSGRVRSPVGDRVGPASRSGELAMDEWLRQWRQLDLYFNMPATPAALAALEEQLGAPLPPELLALYRNHDGLDSLGGPRGRCW